MSYPDDVEYGEIEFDGSDDGQDILERQQDVREADAIWFNTPARGKNFAPSDFIYDPLKEREE